MKTFFSIIAILGVFAGISASAQQCACQAPNTWVAGTCVPPNNPSNACDDGSGSGMPSVVSSAILTPAASPAKFDSVVNKKLACCINSYDPNAPATTLKYDCVDNSTTAYTSFDDLWGRTDQPDSGSQAYGLVLTTGGGPTTSGKPISGFYTLGGSRCTEFSEFAGPIRKAQVNPVQMSGQQEKAVSAGSTGCSIVPNSYVVSPSPSSLTNAVIAAGKTVPYDGASTTDCAEAANMRRCPILVRAAMVATCPRNPALPSAQTSYTDSAGAVHCLAAASIRIYVHMEQIYEVAGMPLMPTVDTYLQQSSSTISIANLIQSKVANACPGGTSYMNGLCMGCSQGCGGVGCKQCDAGTFSNAGDIHCTACNVGTYSDPGSNTCLPCTNTTPGGYYWIGNGTSATNCPTAKCANNGTGFGGVSPNCP